MSTQHTYIGWYLKCRQAAHVLYDEYDASCIGNKNHKLFSQSQRFCSECGAPIVLTPRPLIPISMRDLHKGLHRKWMEDVDPDKLGWVKKNFIVPFVDVKQGYDYVMIEGHYTQLTSTDDLAQEITMGMVSPSTYRLKHQVAINNLQEIMSYTCIDVVFGAIVRNQ